MNKNLPAKPTESPFRLFVSYAHKGEARKDRLLIALAPYKRNGLIETWDDRAIDAGDDWEAEITQAMNRAHAAIFILDEFFLASDFCLDKEVKHFLQRHRDEGVQILFVLADYCGWEAFDFIKRIQIVPPDGKPIVAFRPQSKAYTSVAEQIEQKLRNYRKKHGLPQRAALATPAAQPATGAQESLLAEHPGPASHLFSLETGGIQPGNRSTHIGAFLGGAGYSPPDATAPGDGSTDPTHLLAKLPGTTAHLFGRDDELIQISEWSAHKGVFLWVADGGTGKSALARKWLERQEWPAGTRFLGHSFYSQGSHNQATSARGFLLDALKQLDVGHEDNAADDELGRLLAEAAARAPTVLVLDGIEPLQQPADDPGLNGTVKDRGLAALLEGVARKPGQALCLASSRLPIPDTRIAKAAYFREETLGLLPPTGARELLRQRGVRGEDVELDAMAERCGRHPLTLVLAAEFCHTYLQDRAADFLSRPWQPQPGEKHAATVMAWFDSALADEHQELDRELARILGLFDRPAPWGALLALKAADPIPCLTEALHGATEHALLESLARLSQWGLLDADLTRSEPDLDAHPLVREHFGELLEREAPQAWQAAHSVLFDWFRSLPDKEQPDTLEELEPLYRAIGYGCKAGRYWTVLREVYWRRIRRENQGYGLFQLGAYSADLAALEGFFPLGWGQPPVAANAGQPGEGLTEADRSWLVSEAAFCLMSLGRLEDALGPRYVDVRMRKQAEDWRSFCLACENLVDLLTPLGRWAEAETVSREGESAAAKDEGQHWRLSSSALAHLGRALHGQGRLSEALAAYAQAEACQAQGQPQHPKLYSLRGYDYAQLLLEQAGRAAGWQEVLARGRTSLEITERGRHLLSQAHDHCTIGLARAALGEADAGLELDKAVTTIQRAGSVDDHPKIHLARAAYRRSLRDLPAAWADHDAAHAIAERGNMRTYLAECALLAGNLCLDQGRAPEAAAHHATAAQLIREDGYGRRLAELHLLRTRLLHAQHDPGAAQALAEAAARIREVGQWYFWRELRAVANEIGAPDPGECPA